MSRRQPRSGRRSSDGLYQSHLHRRIQRRIEYREAAREPLTYPQLRQRAQEAKDHDCEHTHIHPEYLLHLLELRERYLKLRGLVEGHWEDAKKEGESGHSERDLLLWTQGLRWFERQNE
jgi:hypothetical protein